MNATEPRTALRRVAAGDILRGSAANARSIENATSWAVSARETGGANRIPALIVNR
jgi:hypothetical protein